MELLKSIRITIPHAIPLTFSRSGIIQDLTLFIGFLEWIRQTDGNYLLCSKLRKVIRRILDNVLDPPAPSQVSNQPPPTAMMGYSGGLGNVSTVMAPPSTPGIGIVPQLDPALWMPPLDDGDCLSWLEGVDWTTQGYFNNGL